MRIAKELGKSIQEVMQFNVQEIQLWAAWFKMEQEAISEATESKNAPDELAKIANERRGL